MERVNMLTSPPGGAPDPGMDRAALERLKTKELAQEFESMMMLQMLRQMRQKVFEDADEEGLSSSAMIDTMDTELARELSRAGGLGLAAVMIGASEARAAAPTPVEPAGDAGTPGSVSIGAGLAMRAAYGAPQPAGPTAGAAAVDTPGVRGAAAPGGEKLGGLKL